MKSVNLVCELVSDKSVFQDKVDTKMSFYKTATYASGRGHALSVNLSHLKYTMVLLQLGVKFNKPCQWIQLCLLWTL